MAFIDGTKTWLLESISAKAVMFLRTFVCLLDSSLATTISDRFFLCEVLTANFVLELKEAGQICNLWQYKIIWLDLGCVCRQGWPTVDTCPPCGLTCRLWSTTTSSLQTDPARRPEASAKRCGASTRKTARCVEHRRSNPPRATSDTPAAEVVTDPLKGHGCVVLCKSCLQSCFIKWEKLSDTTCVTALLYKSTAGPVMALIVRGDMFVLCYWPSVIDALFLLVVANWYERADSL